MNILVCIKQVPGTSNVEVDEKTGVLQRNGIQSKMNPFDLYTLEQAFCIKAKYGGKVEVLTMGPPQARNVILEAMYMGADGGTLVSDRRFAGSDVSSTAYTLSQAIKKMGNYDLILCGKQTTDGDTAQVGAETAEFLKIEHAANVQRVIEISESSVSVEINLETLQQRVKIELPCLLALEKNINVPRLPSYRRKMQTDESCIRLFSLENLEDQDESHYGLAGSPTQVERIFPPEKNKYREIYDGNSEVLSYTFYNLLSEQKLIREV